MVQEIIILTNRLLTCHKNLYMTFFYQWNTNKVEQNFYGSLCLDKLLLERIFIIFLQVRKYASLQAMRQQSHVDEVGTLSFVTDTGKLYIKVPGGWREIQVNV